MFNIIKSFEDKSIIELTPVIAWQFKNDIITDSVVASKTGSGTVTASEGKGVLQTTAEDHASAKIRTTLTLAPNPGVNVLVKFDAIFSTGIAGNTQIIGIGDEYNGFFFGYNGVNFGILHRQNAVDTWILPVDWNQAPNAEIDGGIYFDPTKGNNYSIAYQNSAFGNVQFAFQHPEGYQVVVHQIYCLNTYTLPKIYNSNLPFMAEVSNDTNDTNITLQTSTAAAFIEGTSRAALSAQINAALGNIYTATTGIVSIDSGEYLVIQLNNPSDSGKIAYIQRVSGGATNITSCEMLKEATFSADGTPIAPVILNLAFLDNSKIEAKYISQATDPTIGGSLIFSIINSGGEVIADYGGGIIVPEGHILLMRIKNLASETNYVATNLTWIELLN